MKKHSHDAEPNILETVDQFIAAVRWGDWRQVLVYRRQHGGHTYICLRTWNRHRSSRFWYPSLRGFVIPLANAINLANAIRDAAEGVVRRKPNWLVKRERFEDGRVEWMRQLDAPLGCLPGCCEPVRYRLRPRCVQSALHPTGSQFLPFSQSPSSESSPCSVTCISCSITSVARLW